LIGLDIFTIDIELAAPSPIQEEAIPKKRKAKDQGIVPTKRRRQADRSAIVALASGSLVLQSRAGRVVRRTSKAKASY
jgi:hypothetical protein